MGKRKTRSGGMESTETSKESTPLHSDSDDNEAAKKNKLSKSTPLHSDSDDNEAAKKNKLSKMSSEALCSQLGVVDVDLEYTDADFQNLTTFSFFSRMVKMQLMSVNSRLPASKQTAILEAKWREFQQLNPYKKSIEIQGDSSSSEEDQSKRDESIEDKGSSDNVYDDEMSGESEKTNTGKNKEHSHRSSTDDSTVESGDDDMSDESALKAKARRSASTLKVKLPMAFGLRKSAREKKQVKAMSDREFKSLLDDEVISSESEDNSDSVRSRKRSRRQKRQYSDDDSPPPNKTRKRKPATPEVSDFVSSDDSPDFDEDSSDDQGNSRRRRSRKPEKFLIPGERKSARAGKDSKKSAADISNMSDRDFEKMLRAEEKEKEEKKREAQQTKKERELERKKEAKRRKMRAAEGKRGYWQAEGEGGQTPPKEGGAKEDGARVGGDKEGGAKEGGESGNESDHYWYCEICKDGGDLLLCDTCPKSYHQDCLKMDIVPDGDWSCPICTGEGLPEEGDSSEEEEQHDQFCKVCKEGGDVILCDFCPFVFHMNCLNPPMKEVPEGEWKCPRCKTKEKPLKAKVTKVLTWRWDHQLKGTDETDHTQSPEKKAQIRLSLEESEKKHEKKPERELFVRFEYHSFWDCEWIPEMALEVFQPVTWNSFRNKFDLNEPPALEDGSSFGRLRHKPGQSEDMESDPHNLEERYYRYGIKPEWLQIHRIISHDGKGKEVRYLVKWRDLPYTDCTWEFPSELPAGLEEWSKHVNSYNTRRKERIKMEEGKKKKDKPKKSTWKKKLEVQPSYIEDTGCTLHPYQLEGLNWLRFSYVQDTNTILADEMGLGKTIQAISFIYSLYQEGFCTTQPFIICAPLSTVPNWEREFELWAPDLYVVTYVGQKETRAVIREREFCYRDGAFSNYSRPCRLRNGYRPKFDVLLTSYEMMSLDMATLVSIEWSVMVIDEAHRLKNNQSLFFRTLSDFHINYKLLLTGTPLQNNLEELFNLLNFLEPGKFDRMQSFLDEFAILGKDDQVVKLHEMLAPHMLRRLKMDVLKDLPCKSEFIVRVELSPMQKKFYKHVLTKNYTALNVRGYGHTTSLINIMMDLRKTCNHPYLFPTAEKEAPLSKRGLYEGSALTKASGKMDLLAKMLAVLRRDKHRVLIFSQMTRNLDLLEDFLDYHKYGYERIDGSIMGSKRQVAIDRFNSNESESFVFLLSTRAGGLGINLATADTVIIYDMDWNPHNDIQAFSRAHRIGQKNKVMIYRFVCRNTVEEKIAQVCKKKMMLSELIVHKGVGNVAEKKDSLSKEEIGDILKFGAEDLFQENDDAGSLVYDEAAVEKLMDRSLAGEELPDVDAEKEGMNEYLRSFKVASYQLKEGADQDDEEEEEEPVVNNDTETALKAAAEQSTRRKTKETDQEYWDRVLRDSYQEHVVHVLEEQEAIARTLGKGKRVRKQINYLERDNQRIAEEKRRKKAGHGSDYEPSSDDDSDSGDGVEVVDANGETTTTTAAERKMQRKKEKKELREKRAMGGGDELPPLIHRTGPNMLEVLGFTCRQRRAFLDSVMRFGLPPEDVCRSQWMCRDLRSKPERVVRAYAALFLRHLCEPVSDSVETFADGVPREGLSRQNVLSRVGMMALIRRKVNEFERVNGTDSMRLFGQKPKVVRAVKEVENVAEKETGKEGKSGEGKNGVEEKKEEKMEVDDGEKGKRQEEKDGVPMEVDEGKKGDGGEKKADDDEQKGSEAEKKETDIQSSESREDVEAEPKTPEKKAEEKAEEKSEEKTEEIEMIVEETEKAADQTEEKAEQSEKKADVTENATDEIEEKAKETVNKAEETEKKDEEEASGKKADETEKKADETKKKADETEKKADETEKKADETEKKAVETEKKAIETEKKAEETEKKSDDVVEVIDVDADEPKLDYDWSSLSMDKRASIMRQHFWISDGGFTELHSLWAYEDQKLKRGVEAENWHRIHDYWLLAGVVTHGYRHWQDILFDPRFEALNKVFSTAMDKARKVVYLNRRFQILNVGLVVEEQLCKAAQERGVTLPYDNPSERLEALDKWSEKLKSYGRVGTAPPEPAIKTVLNKVASLVTDIKLVPFMTGGSYSMQSITAPPVPSSRQKQVTLQKSIPRKNLPPTHRMLAHDMYPSQMQQKQQRKSPVVQRVVLD